MASTPALPATPGSGGGRPPLSSGGRSRSAAGSAEHSLPPSSRAVSSTAGVVDRPMAKAQSTPELEPPTQTQPLQVSLRTRQIQYRRTPMGGFHADAPAWQVNGGASPVMPSRHHVLSRKITSNFQPMYFHSDKVSESRAALIHHAYESPKTYNRARDGISRFAEERFKLGNQQIMRKGGGSMARTA